MGRLQEIPGKGALWQPLKLNRDRHLKKGTDPGPVSPRSERPTDGAARF
jgi:hypothetical protein